MLLWHTTCVALLLLYRWCCCYAKMHCCCSGDAVAAMRCLHSLLLWATAATMRLQCTITVMHYYHTNTALRCSFTANALGCALGCACCCCGGYSVVDTVADRCCWIVNSSNYAIIFFRKKLNPKPFRIRLNSFLDPLIFSHFFPQP